MEFQEKLKQITETHPERKVEILNNQTKELRINQIIIEIKDKILDLASKGQRKISIRPFNEIYEKDCEKYTGFKESLISELEKEKIIFEWCHYSDYQVYEYHW